jgi:hypothetical protein
MMTKDANGILCCNHCGDQIKDGATVFCYEDKKTGGRTYFCHGVCAGAYMDGILNIKNIVPSMVTLAKYTRPKGSMITYRISAWVHPKNGGDDYSIGGEMTLPKETPNPDEVVKAEIVKILKKKRSAILDDYTFEKVAP